MSLGLSHLVSSPFSGSYLQYDLALKHDREQLRTSTGLLHPSEIIHKSRRNASASSGSRHDEMLFAVSHYARDSFYSSSESWVLGSRLRSGQARNARATKVGVRICYVKILSDLDNLLEGFNCDRALNLRPRSNLII